MVEQRRMDLAQHWILWKEHNSVSKAYPTVQTIENVQLCFENWKSAKANRQRNQTKFRKHVIKTVTQNVVIRRIFQLWSIRVLFISRSRQIAKCREQRIKYDFLHAWHRTSNDVTIEQSHDSSTVQSLSVFQIDTSHISVQIDSPGSGCVKECDRYCYKYFSAGLKSRQAEKSKRKRTSKEPWSCQKYYVGVEFCVSQGLIKAA